MKTRTSGWTSSTVHTCSAPPSRRRAKRRGSGAIIVLAPGGGNALCHPFSPTPVNMQDVAAGTSGVFSTLLAYPGRILAWGRVAVPSAAAGGLPPAAGSESRCAAARQKLRAATKRVRRLKAIVRNARGAGRKAEARAKLRKAQRKARRAKKRKKPRVLSGARRRRHYPSPTHG